MSRDVNDPWLRLTKAVIGGGPLHDHGGPAGESYGCSRTPRRRSDITGGSAPDSAAPSARGGGYVSKVIPIAPPGITKATPIGAAETVG